MIRRAGRRVHRLPSQCAMRPAWLWYGPLRPARSRHVPPASPCFDVFALLPFGPRVGAHQAARRGLDKRGAEALFPVAQPLHHFALDVLHELVHLELHLLDAAAHVQDDLDAREVDAEIARQREDRFQLLEILIRAQAGVALRARRLEQPFALVEAERLRVDVVALRHRADHVVGLAACPFAMVCLYPPRSVVLNVFRRCSRAEFADQILRSFVRHGAAAPVASSTIRSPGGPPRIDGAPRSPHAELLPRLRARRNLQLARRRPDVGTSTCAPSAASCNAPPAPSCADRSPCASEKPDAARRAPSRQIAGRSAARPTSPRSGHAIRRSPSVMPGGTCTVSDSACVHAGAAAAAARRPGDHAAARAVARAARRREHHVAATTSSPGPCPRTSRTPTNSAAAVHASSAPGSGDSDPAASTVSAPPCHAPPERQAARR